MKAKYYGKKLIKDDITGDVIKKLEPTIHIEATASEVDRVEAILDSIGYEYDATGTDESTVYWIPVYEKKEYTEFMTEWKATKKVIK